MSSKAQIGFSGKIEREHHQAFVQIEPQDFCMCVSLIRGRRKIAYIILQCKCQYIGPILFFRATLIVLILLHRVRMIWSLYNVWEVQIKRKRKYFIGTLWEDLSATAYWLLPWALQWRGQFRIGAYPEAGDHHTTSALGEWFQPSRQVQQRWISTGRVGPAPWPRISSPRWP